MTDQEMRIEFQKIAQMEMDRMQKFDLFHEQLLQTMKQDKFQLWFWAGTVIILSLGIIFK